MAMVNPPHPGGLVKDNLEELKMSINGYAKLIGVSPSTVSRLVNEEIAISAEMAVKLAATIGSTPEQWLRLQASYDLWQAQQKVDISLLHRIRPLELETRP
ncbi:HigA family addiction module antitoxin [Enterobacter pseudoroggenkampii]|uniref:HigA family addiction module antitoxin n=1 Tax=Enterobacter pseudoroggenkampii TaxID=2996112 RepID=UPI002263FF85|nr:HigA family addiction module antitoxin [Enterobacter pseudoroggenkampii]MCX8289081.1 HigA family addiction module antitoxin [Enterobacter pseudoroggenkampii]